MGYYNDPITGKTVKANTSKEAKEKLKKPVKKPKKDD